MDFDPDPQMYAYFNFGQYISSLDLQQEQVVTTLCQGETSTVSLKITPMGGESFINGHKVEYFFVLGKCQNCKNLMVGEVFVHPEFSAVMTIPSGAPPPPFEFSRN